MRFNNKKLMIGSFLIGGVITIVALETTPIKNIINPQPLQVIPYELFDSKGQPATNNPNQGYLVMVKTSQLVDKTNDPIWRVELVVNGKVVDYVEALSGRSYRQTANRDTSGNKSPLPMGRYSIDRQGISRAPFDDPELGRGYWIPISPLFSTGRSSLGIHQDPSWGKTNGESGTSGCVGLRSPEDTAKVADWVAKYDIRTLIVQS